MGLRNRDQFLNQLEGVFVDDDPAQGVIEGRTFTHPDLRIFFAVPQGYLMQNGTTEVSISGTAGKALFSGGRYNGSLENYINLVLQQLSGGQVRMAVPPSQRTMINGIPAAYTTARANTSSGRGRRQRLRLSVEPEHGVPLRDADAGAERASVRLCRWWS